MKYIKCSHCRKYIPIFDDILFSSCPSCEAPITQEEMEKSNVYHACPVCDTLINVRIFNLIDIASSPFYCKVCGRRLYLDEENDLRVYNITKEYEEQYYIWSKGDN